MSNALPAVGAPRTQADASAQVRTLVGDSGLWFFIAADTLAFGVFFLVFTIGRHAQPALYESAARHLQVELGLLNTVILLSSGALMAQAVLAARRLDRAALCRYLVLAMLVGSVFAVSKVCEYTSKIQAGITLLSNEFYMYYFVFTGVHFLHFLVGMVALMVALSKARQDTMGPELTSWVESTGAYWHMVDLLWIMLFPLLYLQR